MLVSSHFCRVFRSGYSRILRGCKCSHLLESRFLSGIVLGEFSVSGRESCPGHDFLIPEIRGMSFVVLVRLKNRAWIWESGLDWAFFQRFSLEAVRGRARGVEFGETSKGAGGGEDGLACGSRGDGSAPQRPEPGELQLYSETVDNVEPDELGYDLATVHLPY